MSSPDSLRAYLAAVARRVDAAVDHNGLHPQQRELLHATVQRPRARSLAEPLGDPLSLTYLIAQAGGRRMDSQAEQVGAFCLLYVLALDLLDDVQDDDLAGTPHADAGAAIAINSAVTLLFLAIDQLHAALAQETGEASRLAYVELLHRVAMLASVGQHRDLLGSAGALTPEDVLENQLAKTSSVSLLAECGALLAGCDEATCERYRTIGERMAMFIQVRDDLRDIYGKEASPDLLTGKVTYPIACFLQEADETGRAELDALVVRLPHSMRDIRDLLYRSGAVAHCAATLDRLREDIHLQVAAVDNRAASLRTLLDVVDGLAETVYEPPPIQATRTLWHPRGPWHERVRAELERFAGRVAHFGLPEPPTLRPWHLPQWMYVPDKRTIFYPDIEGLAGEILPFQAMLLGESDLDEVAHILEEQLPTVLAHEMFHFWRDACGRLTHDHWHEEWAANRLAVAYGAVHEPAALASSQLLAKRVLGTLSERLDEQVEGVLRRCHHPDAAARGYGMDIVSVAVTTLEMLRRLADEKPAWPEVLTELLEPTGSDAALSS